MKINDVVIANWKAPGDEWWDSVQSKPDEPLIEATMKLTLSWSEYHRLMEMDKQTRGDLCATRAAV